MTVQPSSFAGTAAYYAQYRPPYPDALLAELRSRVKTTGSGALLDLACGPGRVAIPLAQHFNTVLAVDAEAEMIAVGKRQAAARGVTTSIGALRAPGSAASRSLARTDHDR